jgi:DNA modification methylase
MSERCADGVEHGDVFELLPSLEEDSGNAAVVDFPWKFNAENGSGRFQSTDSDREFQVYQTEDHDRLADVLAELSRVLVDGAWVFVFADDDTVPEFRECLEESPLTYRRTCVWDREKFGMGYYHRVQHYPILTATNGETDRYVQGRGTVYRALKHDGEPSESDYPTGKPVKLYRQMLAEPVLGDGERLIEPFCGHGPGAAVATERGLDYWGADTNPEAVEKARQQLEQSRLTESLVAATDGGETPDKSETNTERSGTADTEGSQ